MDDLTEISECVDDESEYAEDEVGVISVGWVGPRDWRRRGE